MDQIKRICKNCADYKPEEKVCSIRFTIMQDKSRVPMQRQQNQAGCKVFMYAP